MVFMKGLAIDKEYIVGLIIVMIVFLVAGVLFMRVFGESDPAIETKDLNIECAKWASLNPPCRDNDKDISKTLNSYPALKEAFGDDRDGAKQFCNCPHE
ncbi:MAG: hypothetical protein ACP5E4_00915 [Candidatus Aenigmatarchaeota archaeon]